MADLADQIDDYICTFEGVGDLTMDTLAMLIFVWAVLALFVVWLAKFLYTKYVKGGASAASAAGSVDTSKIGTSPSEKLSKRGSEPRELSASKDIKGLDLAAKPLGKLGGAARAGARSIGGGVGGAGQPLDFGPSTRKRLSRKSPGPELRKPNRSVLPPSNVVGPETSSVTWTSQVFRWLYSDLVIVNELLHSWVLSLNEETKKSVESAGVAVEVIRVLPESPAPNLTNIFCHSEEATPSEMVITLDCDAMPVLQLKTFRQKAGKVETAHYKATVSRLRARLSVPMSYTTLKGDMKVEGYPDVKIALNSIGPIKTMDADETQLQEVIVEILTNAFSSTVFPVDFSIYSTCPRAIEAEPAEIPYNMEHLNPTHPYNSSPLCAVPSGKRLLVKVVKGEGLTSANDPYCVVEMDEPPQKNQTGARAGQSPLWDEHFLFDLSGQSAEILFEVYDRPARAGDAPKFLGLGLVGIDELAVGPASSQLLALQPRPYETEAVSGVITVDFVFIEGAEVPAGRRPYKFKEAIKITNPAQLNGLGYQNGHDLANTAIKALEDGALSSNGNGTQPSKSTLIIHSVQRTKERPYYYRPGEPIAQSSPYGSPQQAGNGGQQQQAIGTDAASGTATAGDDLAGLDERGRARKKRDFFGTLKRKLGRSKSRAKSMDRAGGMIEINADNPTTASGELRSVSADRGTLNGGNGAAAGGANSSGRRLHVPNLDQSRRSSLSESSAISGFSSASAKTYVHEASTLVLETIENGVKRHFLVPLAVAQRPRWRRKGTKLHIYNDHTFVAKHLSGGLTCDVCNRSIPRRPGKQGYECRDCQQKCHKQCHVRIPQACSNPTSLSLELSQLPTLQENQM